MELSTILITAAVGFIALVADFILRPMAAPVEPKSATILLFDYHKSA